jgi:hypothetical protein
MARIARRLLFVAFAIVCLTAPGGGFGRGLGCGCSQKPNPQPIYLVDLQFREVISATLYVKKEKGQLEVVVVVEPNGETLTKQINLLRMDLDEIIQANQANRKVTFVLAGGGKKELKVNIVK